MHISSWRWQAMKSHKSQHTTSKHAKKASLKKLSKYIDEEVTVIHENLEELIAAHRFREDAQPRAVLGP